MTTQVQTRDFSYVIDEPEPIGGNNTAPTPMEFVVGAVNGCITVVIETVAAELGLELRSLTTESHAHMDVRGFRGTAEVSPHFLDYALTIDINIAGDESQRQTLVQQSEKRCPAINLVRDAGVTLDIDWRFKNGASA